MHLLFHAKKSTVFRWTPACDDSFCKIVEYFSDDILLHFSDYLKQFFINCDASNFGIGGILYQSDGPVSIFNRSLQNAKLNYSTIDHEFLALTESVKKFRPYIFGCHFTVYSDHKALGSMLTSAPANSRHARYLMTLEEYDFDLQYKPGSKNTAADIISRLTPTCSISVIDSDSWPQDQEQDAILGPIRASLKRGCIKTGFSFDSNDILCYYGKYVVPKTKVNHLIELYHTIGHFSISKTRAAILGAGYWFPKMRKLIMSRIQHCVFVPVNLEVAYCTKYLLTQIPFR